MWGSETSQETGLLLNVQWCLLCVINQPPASKPTMPNLLCSKNEGILTVRLGILAFPSSTLGPQSLGSAMVIPSSDSLQHTKHLPLVDHIFFFFFLTFGKTRSGRKVSFYQQQRAPLPAQRSCNLPVSSKRGTGWHGSSTNVQKLPGLPSRQKADITSGLPPDLHFPAIGFFREFHMTHKRTASHPHRHVTSTEIHVVTYYRYVSIMCTRN